MSQQATAISTVSAVSYGLRVRAEAATDEWGSPSVHRARPVLYWRWVYMDRSWFSITPLSANQVQEHLRGVAAGLLTPFDEAHEINHDELAENASDLYEEGDSDVSRDGQHQRVSLAVRAGTHRLRRDGCRSASGRRLRFRCRRRFDHERSGPDRDVRGDRRRRPHDHAARSHRRPRRGSESITTSSTASPRPRWFPTLAGSNPR